MLRLFRGDRQAVPSKSQTQNPHMWRKNGESPPLPSRRNKFAWNNKYTESGRTHAFVSLSSEFVNPTRYQRPISIRGIQRCLHLRHAATS